MTNPLSLADRTGLPDALRVLIEEFPRDGWAGHKNYSQLIAFWLDRHLMFRRLMAELGQDADMMLDKAIDPEKYKQRLSRFGGMLINELHGHHQIEDQHYFPVMAALDTRVSAGFDLLDKDHHALDGILAGLTEGANAVLQAPPRDKNGFQTAVADLQKQLNAFDPMLNRHLIDEEELVVPVLLRYAPAQLQ
ncbi:MAG: hemerythrin domain-containing protein [Sulfitobacter sp.]